MINSTMLGRTRSASLLPAEHARLSAVHMAVGVIVAHELVHICDVVILRNFTVLLEIRTFMCWHCLYEVFDDLFWNEGVSKIQLSDIRLVIVSKLQKGRAIQVDSPCHLQLL